MFILLKENIKNFKEHYHLFITYNNLALNLLYSFDSFALIRVTSAVPNSHIGNRYRDVSLTRTLPLYATIVKLYKIFFHILNYALIPFVNNLNSNK